jgi:hypothetical protein
MNSKNIVQRWVQKWSNVRVKVVRQRQGACSIAAAAATGKAQAEGG